MSAIRTSEELLRSMLRRVTLLERRMARRALAAAVQWNDITGKPALFPPDLPRRLSEFQTNVNTLDCNTTTGTGWYAGYIWTNAPANTIGTLEVIHYSPDWIAQTFTVLGDAVGRIYHRIRHSGTTWSAWVEQPRTTIPQLAPSAPITSYPMGSSVFLCAPDAGWPLSGAGAVHTIRAWSDGGAIQYWTGYNTYEGIIYFRQWLLGGGGVWTAWRRLAVPGQDGVPYAQAWGNVAQPAAIAMNAGADLSGTFPAGRFTQVPILIATVERAARINVAVSTVTTSGFTVRLDNWSNNNAALPIGVNWVATQMTATAGAG